MAKRKSQAPEVKKERRASSCIWDLFSARDSWQVCFSHKLISDVLPPLESHDHHWKLQHLTNFDYGCRKYQDGTAQKFVMRRKLDGEVFDLLVQVHKREKRKKAESVVDELFLAHKTRVNSFSDAKNSQHDQHMDSAVARKISSSPAAAKFVFPIKKQEQVDCGCSSMISRTLSKASHQKEVIPFFLRGKKKNTLQGTAAQSESKREEVFRKKYGKAKEEEGVSSASKRRASSGFKKQEFDMNSEAIRHLSLRLKKNVQAEEEAKKSPKTLKHILSSSDHVLRFIGSTRDSHNSSGILQKRTSSFEIEERFDKLVHESENINSQDVLQGTPNRNIPDSIPENGLSPPVIGISPEKGSDDATQLKLQPLLLDSEESSLESSPKIEGVMSSDSCKEEQQSHLSNYVHSLLQASLLNWNKLSEIEFPSEELSQDSSSDEASSHCYFDRKLLFDHVNEVLMEMQRQCGHFSHKAVVSKPEIQLVEAAMSRIMNQAVFFHLLPQRRRSLDQIISEDVAEYRCGIDILTHTETVVNQISEGILEESVIDMLHEIVT